MQSSDANLLPSLSRAVSNFMPTGVTGSSLLWSRAWNLSRLATRPSACRAVVVLLNQNGSLYNGTLQFAVPLSPFLVTAEPPRKGCSAVSHAAQRTVLLLCRARARAACESPLVLPLRLGSLADLSLGARTKGAAFYFPSPSPRPRPGQAPSLPYRPPPFIRLTVNPPSKAASSLEL